MVKPRVALAGDRDIMRVRGALIRIAQAASQIAEAYDTSDPMARGFADPARWKCSQRYCRHHARCPGGAGL